MDATTLQVLFDLYQHLRDHFGYAPGWWPGSPMEIFITAILVQQCDWSQAWNAAQRLREDDRLSFAGLSQSAPEKIERLIMPVAFAPTKSKRLVALTKQLVQRDYRTVEELLDHRRDTATLREELLSLQGIGEETADCILLFASKHPRFVVDTYTRRVFERLDLFPELSDSFWRRSTYRTLQDFFESALLAEVHRFEPLGFDDSVPLPVAVLRDFHAQIVELAKHHCLRTKPRCHAAGVNGWSDYFFCQSHCNNNACSACPLSETCRSGKENLRGG